MGGTTCGYWHRRIGRPSLGFGIAQAICVLSPFVALYVTPNNSALSEKFHEMAKSISSSPDWIRSLILYWIKIRFIVLNVEVPSICMGRAFPLVNAHVQRVESMVGKRAG